MNQILKDQLFSFYETCYALKGNVLHIRTSISTNRDNFNRHFTTFSVSEFQLINFGVRISGGRAMFMGNKQSYEIGGDMIISFLKISQSEFQLIEQYSETVYRKSVIKFEPKKF